MTSKGRRWREAVGDYFVFMDDNDRPHLTRVMGNDFEMEGFIGLNRPALSPDMNPIDHAWDMLSRTI